MNSLYKPVVMIVDDSLVNLGILSAGLEEFYETVTIGDGATAIEQIGKIMPDLVILDVVMPDVDGMEVYTTIQKNPATAEIPVIFVTAVDDIDFKVKLLDLGAADYITKPFNMQEVRARVNLHMKHAINDKAMKKDIEQLTVNVNIQSQEMQKINDRFRSTLINMMLLKSKETGQHLIRTKFYVEELLKGYEERFQCELDPAIIEAAALHDIGKIGIADQILMKPGRLTDEEYSVIKTHTTVGKNLLSSDDIVVDGEILEYAKEIAHYHHERWDGKGYPTGLSGGNIPISARMMALADVYDALVSKRVYKQSLSHEDAVKIIVQEREKAFDPSLVDIFVEKQEIFREIREKYEDKEKE